MARYIRRDINEVVVRAKHKDGTEVDAVQVSGDPSELRLIGEWLMQKAGTWDPRKDPMPDHGITINHMTGCYIVKNESGLFYISFGDWLITTDGVNFYPGSSLWFSENYEIIPAE